MAKGDYHCDICEKEISLNVCLCEDCDKIVKDWNPATDSYERLDGEGTYYFNKDGKYELRVTCEYCEGKGEYLDGYDDIYGNHTEFISTCECCKGEGTVVPLTQEELANIDKLVEKYLMG